MGVPKGVKAGWVGPCKNRLVDSEGYSYVLLPGHHLADKDGYVVEHVLLAEMALGKPLPDKAVVHHAKETLVICQDQVYHMLLHSRQRAIEVCGNANWKKCPFCKEYSDPMLLVPVNGQGDLGHLLCRTWYQRKKRWEKERKNDGVTIARN
jgi:hypothetical protein